MVKEPVEEEFKWEGRKYKRINSESECKIEKITESVSGDNDYLDLLVENDSKDIIGLQKMKHGSIMLENLFNDHLYNKDLILDLKREDIYVIYRFLIKKRELLIFTKLEGIISVEDIKRYKFNIDIKWGHPLVYKSFSVDYNYEELSKQKLQTAFLF